MSEEYRRRGWWRDETFLDDLRRHTREHPGKAAVIARRTGSGETRTLDYAELGLLTDRCAGALIELGVRPGDTVAVQLTNGWELTVLALGCLRAGAQICPLLPIYRERELEAYLGLTRARVFITLAEFGGEAPGELGLRLAAALPSLEHVVVSGGAGPEGARDLHEFFFEPEWEKTHAADLGGRGLGPDEPYLTLFTSGTTGEPKGVLHSQNTLYAPLRGEAGIFDLDDTDLITMIASYTHYTGFVRGMLLPLSLGATAVFQDSTDGAAMADLLAEHKVTYLYTPPHFLRPLVDAQRAGPRDLAALRCVVSGSAPIPTPLVHEVDEVIGRRLFSLWGMSENGAVTLSRPDDPLDWAAHSDGSPISDMEFRIDPLPGKQEETGVLWVRGPTQCLGYLRREELYASFCDEDGWFDTGDLARHDGRGGIRITGRTKDTVFRNGFFVPTTEMEEILTRHPGVEEAAVIGLPVLGGADQVICAVVRPAAANGGGGDDGGGGSDGIGLEGVRALLRDAGMSAFFWPERLELVDGLPRAAATGKVRKVELQQRFA
ncbi:AMP-binding protein [Actinomadura barringtoniae]|uniref:AMP-binding protein n=1 Tax=Actinomadura barringtoniae TaxID=1427535 RepID=A0A939T4Q4_9ACTN|nr:AMP-binding protein [Actinomadura barringtoniae]MBO2452826.1 AMP-binding protein [Actinomadura barringtoniae]